MSAATRPAASVLAVEDVPVVESFAVAAHLRTSATGTSATGTSARVAVALPTETRLTAGALVAALLSLGQHVLTDYQLTGHELPEVEVTAVERVDTVAATTGASGFTVGVTNDLAAWESSIVVDSELLLDNDDGVLLIAATLYAGAVHLLEAADSPTDRHTPGMHRPPRRRSSRARN